MTEDPAHPRETYAYEGNEAAETAFLDAIGHGRLHHAWLLCGPKGIGKATFGYRAARRLLGARPDDDYGLLGSGPDDPESRLVAAGTHPDLLVLEREVEGDKVKKVISVDAARDLPAFFSVTPSRSAYRVAIVDAADDMNVNAANALLKTLEEPPERGVLFLVAHAPGRLLATIRSRCRRLTFQPWSDEAVAAYLTVRRGDLSADAVHRIAAMARGAPGRALTLAAGDALTSDDVAGAMIEGEAPSEAELLSIVDRFRGAEGQDRFEVLLDRLAERVRERVTTTPGLGHREGWADLWSKLSSAAGEAEALNLDKADVFWSLASDLKKLRALS